MALATYRTPCLATLALVLVASCGRERPSVSSTRCRLAPIHDTVGPANPDLCRHAEHVVIGEVDSRESWRGTEDEGRLSGRVVTRDRVGLRVTHVLAGPDRAGEVLDLIFAGGELDGMIHGVPGSPTLELDLDYLLFLSDRPGQHYPVILAQRWLPADLDIPDEAVLRSRWAEFCAANAEGVHPVDVERPRLVFLLDDCPIRLH